VYQAGYADGATGRPSQPDVYRSWGSAGDLGGKADLSAVYNQGYQEGHASSGKPYPVNPSAERGRASFEREAPLTLAASRHEAGESYSYRTCRSCKRQVRVQLGQDFPKDHASGCREQGDYPGRPKSKQSAANPFMTDRSNPFVPNGPGMGMGANPDKPPSLYGDEEEANGDPNMGNMVTPKTTKPRQMPSGGNSGNSVTQGMER
jgi:hypothetical protein